MRNAMRPQSEPHMRIADATDGRTNIRRSHNGCGSSFGPYRAAGEYDGLATIGEVIQAGVIADGTRHEVTRTGDRQPVPPHIRSAVWYRDHGRCELCADGTLATPWELDHITPWSAGGSDDTTNLRVLCQRHNQERSNYLDPHERPRRPATWWCLNCYALDGRGWDYRLLDGIPLCPQHPWGGITKNARCRVTAGYLRTRELFGELPTWHQRPPIEEAHTIAYCAHCNVPGLTDRPL